MQKFETYSPVVVTEVTTKHFILASMDGPQDSLILDDGAFYACDARIADPTIRPRSVSPTSRCPAWPRSA